MPARRQIASGRHRRKWLEKQLELEIDFATVSAMIPSAGMRVAHASLGPLEMSTAVPPFLLSAPTEHWALIPPLPHLPGHRHSYESHTKTFLHFLENWLVHTSRSAMQVNSGSLQGGIHLISGSACASGYFLPTKCSKTRGIDRDARSKVKYPQLYKYPQHVRFKLPA